MSTYTIRPTSKGFGVYGGRTWFGRPKLIEDHDRLYNAEQHALHLVTQDYHRLLDYHRLTNQTMSTDMMNPRVNEEHVYTALVLAGKKPASASGDEYQRGMKPALDGADYDKILESVLGKPISLTARVMFEERFMTWYGQQPANVGWVDPRREREYDVYRDALGRNRYRSSLAELVTETPALRGVSESLLTKLRSAMRKSVFRNFGREDTRPDASNQAQSE